MEIAVSVDPFTVKHIFYLFLCLGSLKAHLWEMETVEFYLWIAFIIT